MCVKTSKAERVAHPSKACNGTDRNVGQEGAMPKGLTCRNVGEMDLDEGVNSGVKLGVKYNF